MWFQLLQKEIQEANETSAYFKIPQNTWNNWYKSHSGDVGRNIDAFVNILKEDCRAILTFLQEIKQGHNEGGAFGPPSDEANVEEGEIEPEVVDMYGEMSNRLQFPEFVRRHMPENIPGAREGYIAAKKAYSETTLLHKLTGKSIRGRNREELIKFIARNALDIIEDGPLDNQDQKIFIGSLVRAYSKKGGHKNPTLQEHYEKFTSGEIHYRRRRSLRARPLVPRVSATLRSVTPKKSKGSGTRKNLRK